ncbi:unnamed protein product, partial [Urochloa humidicola]
PPQPAAPPAAGRPPFPPLQQVVAAPVLESVSTAAAQAAGPMAAGHATAIGRL